MVKNLLCKQYILPNSIYLDALKVFIFLCMCVHVCAHVCTCTHMYTPAQVTILLKRSEDELGDQLSPSTMCTLVVKLGSAGLVAGAVPTEPSPSPSYGRVD